MNSTTIIIMAIIAMIVFVWLGMLLLQKMIREAAGSEVIQEAVPLEKLPSGLEGLKILFISDIHRRVIDPDLPRQVEKLGGAELVLIGGDVRETGVNLQQVRDNMRLLRSIAPAYAVFGNHDYDEDIAELDACLRAEDVTVLQNRFMFVDLPGRISFKLAGTDDPRTKRDRLEETLKTPLMPHKKALELFGGEAPFTLLMAHDPILAHRCRHSGIAANLVLSGHTHGGQIIFPLLGPAMRTASVRKFRAGWFDLPAPLAWQKTGPSKVRLLVSQGYGTSKAPIRLNCPPVIHLLSLERND